MTRLLEPFTALRKPSYGHLHPGGSSREDVSVRLLPFFVVAVIVVITPGVDMALVTRNALVHGRGQALATAFGVNVCIAAWTVAAALAAPAVGQTSAPAGAT